MYSNQSVRVEYGRDQKTETYPSSMSNTLYNVQGEFFTFYMFDVSSTVYQA